MIFSVAYFFLFFSLYLALLLFFLFNRPPYSFRAPTPPVSILIAVRNEEQTILSCLAALEKLEYPLDQIEVLVGDDNSTDHTWAILQNYKSPGFTFRCVRIRERLGLAQGKGNVIAHLARMATSDFFFITDADIRVPPAWVASMLAQVQGQTGIVTGITTITGDRILDRMQAIDWLYSLGLMQSLSDLKLPVSTMGNNMLITKSAYASVGGYENISFSVTEDVQLFRAVIRKGWKTVNVFHQQVLAFSSPAADVGTLLHQRKRWMRGSMHLPWYMIVVLMLHAAYYPVILPFFLHTSVATALSVFGAKLVLQSIYIRSCFRRVRLDVPSASLLLLFELYMLVSSLVLIVFYFLPVKINWKGRRY